ncbi:hypothetical protein HXX01_04835 [Candidatus Nomurabacteria bacterium]|nr:hypothetical protein [Candidatus Nomurabacteria bacterium]
MTKKKLTPDLYDEEWPTFLRKFLSMEFKTTDNLERRLFNKEIENLQVVIIGNGISKKQNGTTEVAYLQMIFLVPDEEKIFAVFEGRTSGVSYSSRKSSKHEFEDVKDIPEKYKELQKFIMKLFKENGIVFS